MISALLAALFGLFGNVVCAGPCTSPGGVAYLSAGNLETPSLNSGLNTTIPNGGSATLTWDAPGALSCAGTGFSTSGSPGIGSVIVSPTTTTTYSVNCGQNTASATVTVSGTRRDAAALDCGSHGGGDGSAGNPWHAACIIAAFAAVSAGDTVFLAAGNWQMGATDPAPATTSKPINLVGKGSGNTFDVYGHPNNGFTTSESSFYANVVPGGSITRVYTTGDVPAGGTGGFIQFANCTAGSFSISHIFIDGSQGTSGGDGNGTLNVQNCSGLTVDDIREWAYGGTDSAETQFWLFFQDNNHAIKNSMLAPPPVINGGFYTNAGILQSQLNNGATITNNMFYQNSYNGFYQDNTTFSDNTVYLFTDSLGTTGIAPALGWAGCSLGGTCGPNGGTSGDFHFFVYNNYFHAPGQPFGGGGGTNDPGTGGEVNDIQWKGNWIIASQGALDSCVWHLETPNCISGKYQGGFSEGMQVNGLTATNNSILATSNAILNATGTGVIFSANAGSSGSQFTGSISGTTLSTSLVTYGAIGIGQYVGGNAGNVAANTQITAGSGSSWTVNNSQTVASELMVSGHNNTMLNYSASQNYLSSPGNQYLNDVNSITPSVTGNYCAGTGTFTGCTQSGFTNPPTCSFTLGTLRGSTIPFTNTSFTAQFGAVQYLASTLSATPASNDARWNNNGSAGVGNSGGNSYIPPASLAVAHGNTVYMWVMDSVNHISACGSAAVP